MNNEDTNKDHYEVHRICKECGRIVGQMLSTDPEDMEVPCPYPDLCDGADYDDPL